MTSVSLWLKERLVIGDGDSREISGVLGLLTSQTYEWVFILSGVCWNLGIAYETANLVAPSVCQDTSLTLLLQTSGGSLNSKQITWRAWVFWLICSQQHGLILHWRNTLQTYRFGCFSTCIFRLSSRGLSPGLQILDLCRLSSWTWCIAEARLDRLSRAILLLCGTFLFIQCWLELCWLDAWSDRWYCPTQ